MAGKKSQNKNAPMADGYNETRAMRVAEVMNDFQRLQQYLMQPQPTPSADDYYEIGYEILRQCRAGATAVLSAEYDADLSTNESGDAQKRQLQRVLLDASARRFQAQKIYLQAVAAARWVNMRVGILQGQRRHAGHTAALQQADNALRAELAAITNERIVNDLRTKDWQAGHWLQEDPSLQAILAWINAH
ncbi:hypothetical protein MMC07_009470 [Pseudocyphellaria aurata]|nr:hypothetical protein [Pseudocyphellaria aurata]